MTPLQEWLNDHNRKLTQDAIDEALLEYIAMIEEYIALVEKERGEAYEAGRAAAMAEFEQVAFQEYTEDGKSYYLAYSRCEGRNQIPLYRLKGEK